MDRYNLMCYITVNNKQQPTYVDDTISGGGWVIPENATTEALQSLGATLNFIYCWRQKFQNNYQVILIMYHEAMIYLISKNNKYKKQTT